MAPRYNWFPRVTRASGWDRHKGAISRKIQSPSCWWYSPSSVDATTSILPTTAWRRLRDPHWRNVPGRWGVAFRRHRPTPRRAGDGPRRRSDRRWPRLGDLPAWHLRERRFPSPLVARVGLAGGGCVHDGVAPDRVRPAGRCGVSRGRLDEDRTVVGV
jgi:hypothetical protein